MSLEWLEVRNFRNFEHVVMELDPGINLVSGKNGSGKTSLLESCYFLSTARSFRESGLASLIQRNEESCLLRGRVLGERGRHHLGINKLRNGERQIRIDSEPVKRASDLARLLPTLVLGPQSMELLVGPPSLRRRFLNWGLFHVKPSCAFAGLGVTRVKQEEIASGFFAEWESANRCLRQRNQLLRESQRSGILRGKELRSWSERLVVHSNRIDELRRNYIELFEPKFTSIAGEFMSPNGARLDYYRGWGPEEDLLEIYDKDLSLDVKRGFTQRGFQRADVRITLFGQPAAKVCSRGELKSLVWAMILAQGSLMTGSLAQEKNFEKEPREGKILYLVDDLASEFDEEHRRRVMGFLSAAGQQTIITGTDRQLLLSASQQSCGRLFHVEHGEVKVQEY